jgi:hypothetical protein
MLGACVSLIDSIKSLPGQQQQVHGGGGRTSLQALVSLVPVTLHYELHWLLRARCIHSSSTARRLGMFHLVDSSGRACGPYD